jgi:hypothetical protein
LLEDFVMNGNEGRYQVVAGGGTGIGNFILIDTHSGRSWRYGSGLDWIPIPFKGEATPAPSK